MRLKRFVGRLLRPVRAGETHLAWNHPAVSAAPDTILLTSASFGMSQPIPTRHAGEGVGDNVSPSLTWAGVPDEARELVLIVEDPDAPLPRPIVHAVAYAIAPSLGALPEGRLSKPAVDAPTDSTRAGKNTFRQARYAGPRPVPGHGVHRYVFQLYALNRPLGLTKPPTRDEVLGEMEGAVIARGRLVGTYRR